MSNVKNEFLKHIWNLPFVDGYLYASLFFSKYPEENVIRYGAIFVDRHRPHFLLLIEVFNKKPDLSNYNSKKIDGEEVYINYVPNFPMVKDILRGKKERDFTTVSWIKKNKFFTVVSIGKNNDVRSYVREILDSNITIVKNDLFPLFKKYKHIPVSVSEWKLVTMFFWFSTIMDEFANPHQIGHIQGNYRKGKDFLNIELRFGCGCPESIPGLKITNIKNEKEVIISQKKVKKGFNPNEEIFMVYVDEEKKFSIICHDNRTNTLRDEKSMKTLMSKSIDLLNYYYPEFLSQQFSRNLV